MKSAYELAMEKLDKEDPTGHQILTDEQRKQIEGIKVKYKAKFAERETFLGGKLLQCEAAGNAQEAAELRLQISRERQRFDEDQEMEINKVYKAK